MAEEAKENIQNEGEELYLHRTSAHLPYGSFEEPSLPFNFRDANIYHLDFGITQEELQATSEMFRQYAGCNTVYPRSLDEIAKGILLAETTFDLGSYKLYASVTGARHAIMQALSFLVNSKKPQVAYVSPNWMFDEVVGSVPGAVGRPFFAFSGDSFVENFEALPEKEKLAAVIIVDPANPLNYRLSEEHVNHIEELSQRYGVVPIFDDVFRGMQQKGERHSASEHSKNSIVVETTSKRFGIRGVGATWTLIPQGIEIPRVGVFKQDCEGCASVAAMITENLYQTGYDTRVAEFVAANARAFKAGLTDILGGELGEKRIVHAFQSMPVMVYRFPKEMAFANQGERISFMTLLQNITGTTAGFAWGCLGTDPASKREIDPREVGLALSYMRICPTKETVHRSYSAGRLFAETIKETLPAE